MRYFITFACYGSHLHGGEPGSVDRNHKVPGSRLAEANPERVAVMRQQMDQVPYFLDKDRRVTYSMLLAKSACIGDGVSGRRMCEAITFL